jgi:hypothetical protein
MQSRAHNKRKIFTVFNSEEIAKMEADKKERRKH